MTRRGIVTLLLLASFCPTIGAEDSALKHALALEEAIQQTAAKVEAGIACVLVSRSDAYRRFESRDSKEPGQLGEFRYQEAVNRARVTGQSIDLVNRLNMAALDQVPDSYGSGVVVDPSGLILTNYHVVRDATKIFVRLPNRPGWYADIYAADERSDLAILKLINCSVPLTFLSPGDGSKLKKGQFLIGLANPYAAGFRDGSPSVTWGMVSNLRRRIPGEVNEVDRRRPRLHYYGTLLQTDLKISLGCSGGALLDLRGNWVGLTTAQAAIAGSDNSGGFAIPLDQRMRRIINVLRRGEEVEYGFLGISMPPGPEGVYVGNVTHNGPAARAGFSNGDRIVSIDGVPINDADDLFLNVGAALAGTEVRVVLQQFSRQRTVNVRLTKAHWPPAGPVIAANRPKPVFGLRVDFTSTMLRAQVAGETGIAPGVVVRDVLPDSPAARAGLRPEIDVITEVNGRPVNSPKEFHTAATGASVELTLAEGSKKVKLP